MREPLIEKVTLEACTDEDGKPAWGWTVGRLTGKAADYPSAAMAAYCLLKMLKAEAEVIDKLKEGGKL